MKTYMKAALLVAVLLAVRASNAQTQVSVGIIIGAPPPPRVAVVPAMPEAGFAWVEGYWYPVGKHYKWHEGYWTRPPYEGAHWVAPHHDGERYYSGYWEGQRGRVEHDHHWDHDQDRDFHDHDRHGEHDRDHQR